MSPQKTPALFGADLPVGGHVKRAEGLIWRPRVHWAAADYKFIAEQYRRLARDYNAIADAIEADRVQRFGVLKDE